MRHQSTGGTNLSRVQESKSTKRGRCINNTSTELRPQLTRQLAKSIGGVWGSAAKQVSAVRGSRGDTIIEVMVSVSILAVVFGVAFSSSNQSLQEGTNASNRNQAVQIAEQQIAIIKNKESGATTPSYPSNTLFCLKSDGSVDTSDISGTPKACNFSSQAPFGVADTFDPSTNTFTIISSWQATHNTTDQVQLYYHSLNAQGTACVPHPGQPCLSLNLPRSGGGLV